MPVVLKYLSDEEERYSIAHADFDLKDELKTASLREGVRILKQEGFTKNQRRFLLSSKDLETKVYDFTQLDRINFNAASYYRGYKRFMQEEGGLSEEQSERLWASYNAGILGDIKSTKLDIITGCLKVGTLAAVIALPTFAPLYYFTNKEGLSGILPGIFSMPIGFAAGIILAAGVYKILTDGDGYDEEREWWYHARQKDFPMVLDSDSD